MKLQFWAWVAHCLFWQLLVFLKVLPSWHVQLTAGHSLAALHGSPGFFGPVPPASGTPPLLPLLDHPPCPAHSEGHSPLAGPHVPPPAARHGAPVTGFAPSLHAQMMGAQSPLVLQPAHPPSLAQAFGQTSCLADEQ